jgi:hypothetical protein
MVELADVAAYLCHAYGHKGELSESRLIKLLYLADWLSALKHRRQLTGIEWAFNHYGPSVDGVLDSIRSDDRFRITKTVDGQGNEEETVRFVSQSVPAFVGDDQLVMDYVVQKAKTKPWDELMRLVYSTYPVLTQRRNKTLDLPALAEEYERQMQAVEKESASPVPVDHS